MFLCIVIRIAVDTVDADIVDTVVIVGGIMRILVVAEVVVAMLVTSMNIGSVSANDDDCYD